MYKHILLPLDGSRLAEQIVPYARQVAKASGAKVTLFNVVSPVDARLSNDGIEKMLQGERTALEQYQKKTEETLRNQGIGADTAIVTGNPADEIIRAVADRKCDLVAMATRGHSGMGRWMFGSTADKVLHAISAPLLLIHPADAAPAPIDKPIRRIVVALDGSELAETVLPPVEDVAKTMQLEVALIRVVPISTFAMATMEPYSYDPRIDEVLTRAATDYLAEVAKRLQQKGLSITSKVSRGDPAGDIVDFARAKPGSLIAMSTHGRSGVGRWVLGSVADRVVRQGGEPVLVFPPPAA